MAKSDSKPTAGLSVRAYEAHRKEHGLPGASRRSVALALSSGRIVRTCSAHPRRCPPGCRAGRICPERADAALAKWAAERRPTATGAYTAARADRERLLVEKMQLEMDAKAGRLVDADRVRSAEFTAARAVRDELLRIARQASPALAGKDPRAIERELRQRLEGALFALARFLREDG